MNDDIAGMAALRRRLRDLAADYAKREIAPRTDLRTLDVPPPELWRALGTSGVAGIGIPESHGGRGGDLRAIAMAGEALASEGGNLGIVTSWMGRQLSARLHILGHGSEAQKKAYLPALAAGEITPCLAISEPKAGAHPKHLKTEARLDGGDYVINGEKAYLTNGPIADIVLLLAITGVADGRKQFSILMVPSDSPGIEITEGVEIDYLKPSPHCGLRLTDVRVPRENLLGPEGDAFNAISLPMRRTEDIIAIANKAGALRHQVRRLAHEVGSRELDEEALAELGRLAAAPDGLSALAYRATELLDEDPDGHTPEIEAISGANRDWIKSLQDRIEAFIDRTALSPSAALRAEARDIIKTIGIAGAVQSIRARKRAEALVKSEMDQEI
jgi:acyl-CoA dehydrogenase